MANGNTVTVNRTFKSTVFIMLFEDKNNLLELYNALNETEYTNTDDLEITTIDDVIYMSMKKTLGCL